MEIATPKRAKISTKAPIGAREPKSTVVPAQSKITARNWLRSFTRPPVSVHLKRSATISSPIAKAVEAPVPDVTIAMRTLGIRRIHQHQPILGAGVSSGPALFDRRPVAEQGLIFVEDQFVKGVRSERIGRVGIDMAVADHHRTIRRADDDKMNAGGQMRALFALETAAQSRGFGKLGIAEIAHQRQIGHHARGKA